MDGGDRRRRFHRADCGLAPELQGAARGGRRQGIHVRGQRHWQKVLPPYKGQGSKGRPAHAPATGCGDEGGGKGAGRCADRQGRPGHGLLLAQIGDKRRHGCGHTLQEYTGGVGVGGKS